MTSKKFRLGDRVSLTKTGHHGRVAYEGKVNYRPGHWVGVALDRPVGLNNGSVKGVRYFDCKARHGIFVPPSALTLLERAKPRARLRAQPRKNIRSNSVQRPTPVTHKAARSSSLVPRVARLSTAKSTDSGLASSKRAALRAKSPRRSSRPGSASSAGVSSPMRSTKSGGSRGAASRGSSAALRASSKVKGRITSPRSRTPSSAMSKGKKLELEMLNMTAALKSEIEKLKVQLRSEREKRSSLTPAVPILPEGKAEDDKESGEANKSSETEQERRVHELERDLATARRDFTQVAAQLKQANERIIELSTLQEKTEELQARYESKADGAQDEIAAAVRAAVMEERKRGEVLLKEAEVNSQAALEAEKERADRLAQENAEAHDELQKLEKAAEEEKQHLLDAKETPGETEERLRSTVEAKEKELQNVIRAAEDHATRMQQDLQRVKEQLEAANMTNRRLQASLGEAQKANHKLKHQNKRLRMKAGGKHSQKHGKVALAQFQRLDQKIKDLQYQIHYGETASIRRIEKLQDELAGLAQAKKKHKDAVRKIKNLQSQLASSKAEQASAWLFSGSMEVL
mmetsp:Transcript_28180/g.54792  ORF Transcript_28180/g.54792 Transcript_28180/m.54792 type:complete len:574 (-) Transcript_28180:107-1828(-)